MSEGVRVQFDDAINPVTSNSGGVYNLRQRTRRDTGSVSGQDVSRQSTKEFDLEGEDNDLEERDIAKKQEFSGWYLLWLAYQSTGVIYGDIGTSPLYVYSSTFTSNPSHDDLLGALSLIIWTLTLMVSVKYVLIVLRADDEGEGGTFALFSLLSRHANIVKRDPREELSIKMERVETDDLRYGAKTTRSFLEKSKVSQYLLRVLGVFGVSLVMSDGVLTPAQSVLGAIQGLEIVKPDIGSPTIIGVSCAIIVLLFLIQPFGTTKLATSFAPIVIVWLLFNFAFGIYNLAVHDATVLKAFSPYFAGLYLVRNGTDGWKSLGGILLAFTGCEALFADLGAFTRRSIQLSWLCFAFPSLLLAYIGQAAYISENPSAWSNPFFASVPPGAFWPSLIIAILAAVVASQAMITAVFQLLSQIMKLSYFPQVKLVHTSEIFYGQIYIPFANWLLMIGTVIVTAAFSNTTNLGHAYGVCVILVTFITTCMVALVALVIWRIPSPVVLFVWLVFACLDGLYLSSALTKVPEGAWLTLALAVILSSIFILWRFGKEQQWRAEASDRFPSSHMLTNDDSDISDSKSNNRGLKLTPAFGGHIVTRISGIGIFFDKAGAPSTIPTVFVHFLQKFHAAPDIVVFFHLRPVTSPTVAVDERYTVTRCFTDTSADRRAAMRNCYRLVIRHGYNDEVITSDLGMLVFEQIRNYVIRSGARSASRRARRVDVREDSYHHHETSSCNLEGESGDLADTSPTTARTTFHDELDSNTTSSRSQTSASDEHKAALDTTWLTFDQRAVSKKLNSLQRAFNDQVVYVVGKEQMRIGPNVRIVRRLFLSAFLWIRENTRSKVQALDVEVDKLVEVGFVKDVV